MRVKAISGHPVLKSHACLSPRRGKVPSRCQRQKKHSCLSPRRGEVSRSDGEGPLLTEGLSPCPPFPSQALSRHPPSRFRRGQDKKRAASRAPRVFFS